MNRLVDRIREAVVPPGQIAAWWLGGSGFVLKTPGGMQVYIDPYLSDVVLDIFGQARASPAPIRPEEAAPDLLVATHWHEDHLDPEAVPIIAKRRPETKFLMPPSAMARALSWGVRRDQLLPMGPGQSHALGDVRISHVPARHEAGIAGWEVPDAMGILLECAGLTVYDSGDTEYDVRLRLLKSRRPDVAVVCINGVSGNMNAHEAALLAWQMGASTVIPVHYALWAENTDGEEATLDPRLFAETYRKLGGAGRVVLPEVGQEIRLQKGMP